MLQSKDDRKSFTRSSMKGTKVCGADEEDDLSGSLIFLLFREVFRSSDFLVLNTFYVLSPLFYVEG